MKITQTIAREANLGEQMIDIVATPASQIQVEFQPEVGLKDKFKLYVHVDGRTVLRIGKLSNEQVDLHVDALL